MTQRKISIVELVGDIQNGMINAEIMAKYQISLESINLLLNKLVTSGHLNQIEIDCRTNTLSKYVCPSCSTAQNCSFDECPKCGIIVAKFKRPKEKQTPKNESYHDAFYEEISDDKKNEKESSDNDSSLYEDTISKLVKCHVCGKLLSRTAEICPNCGEKRFNKKSTTPIIGIVSVGLGLTAIIVPYFAAVFVVPAAIICGIVAIKKDQKSFGVIALILGFVGLAGIIDTSYKISKFTSLFSGKAGEITSPLSSKSKDNVITLFDYENVKSGMPYSEVCTIVGVPGVELSRSDISGFTTIMYLWRNVNGSNMNAMFQNNKLVNKAQFGLK